MLATALLPQVLLHLWGTLPSIEALLSCTAHDMSWQSAVLISAQAATMISTKTVLQHYLQRRFMMHMLSMACR